MTNRPNTLRKKLKELKLSYHGHIGDSKIVTSLELDDDAIDLILAAIYSSLELPSEQETRKVGRGSRGNDTKLRYVEWSRGWNACLSDVKDKLGGLKNAVKTRQAGA